MKELNSTVDNDAQAALSRHLFRAGAALPFLRAPIEQMELVADDAVQGIATDGVHLFYAPGAVPDGPAVAHMLTHCLFRHLIPPEGVAGALWDLACDMSAEYLRGELFAPGTGNHARREIEAALPEDVDPRAAGAVYRSLMELFEDELNPLYERFRRDDHRYWYAPPPYWRFPDTCIAVEGTSGLRDDGGERDARGVANEPIYADWLAEALEGRWPSAEELPGGIAMTGRYGLAPGSREEKLVLRAEGKYDFSRYLRRFSTTREELRLDLDGFDYIPYYYGFERYCNLPMIEPLEYSESFRVESLVIAIDTSGSCTRPIVERFLAEIERVLMSHDYFFSKMEIHIIQCDAVVQSHTVIHSVDEWKQYAKHPVIKGRGGTNFTPVFDLVDKLRKGGALKRLKGLLYFTDGDGVYPRRPTPYETAFVFTTRRALERDIPKWIIPLCLERAERRNVLQEGPMV